MTYVARPFALTNFKRIAPMKFQFSVQVLTSLGPFTTRGWLYSTNPRSRRKLYAPSTRTAKGYWPIITATPHALKVIRKLAQRAVADLERKEQPKEK